MLISSLRSAVTGPVKERLDAAARKFLHDGQTLRVDFAEPKGEPAILGPDSVSWRVFKNPVSLFIGGVAAVILEFADPRVRSGVWDHSTFRTDPVTRLKRTGLAAMITVYGARSQAERLIANVRRMHERVAGVTPSGEPYRANDPELLNWVQATAGYGFLEAYAAYVHPLTDADRDRFYAEGQTSAALYGAAGAPSSLAEQRALFERWVPRFERSDIVFEFLQIMKRAPALPQPLQLMQHSFVRAAVEITPQPVRAALGLDRRFGLRPFEGRVVRRMGRRADRIVLNSSPPVQACIRLGLPCDYLFRKI
ncbi:MAG: oxygenase MpaB family protein [Parvularculaceae bacterium]